MSQYATLKAAIAAVIKQNGNNEITGPLLQQALMSMIDSLGTGYQFVDVAVLTPTPTNPGTPDQNVFYIASEPGTYANFDGIVVNPGELSILKYNGSWSKKTLPITAKSADVYFNENVNETLQKRYSPFIGGGAWDKTKYIEELYFSRVPSGFQYNGLKNYGGFELFFYTSSPTSYILCRFSLSGLQNGVVYDILITGVNNAPGYTVGEKIGYVIFKDVDGFADNPDDGSTFNNLNLDYLGDIKNSPSINIYLNQDVTTSKIKDEAVTTQKLSKKSVTNSRLASNLSLFCVDSGQWDKSPYVSELYITNIIPGNCLIYSLKHQNAGLSEFQFVVQPESGKYIIGRGQATENNTSIPITVYYDNTGAGLTGQIMAYIVFNDYVGFIDIEDGTYNDNNVNYAFASKLSNAPIIYSYLSQNAGPEPVEINMPDVIYCVVGSTQQLFYRGMFKCVNPYIYDIHIYGDIGAVYPRYYEVTPTVDDIGDHTLNIQINDNNGHNLGTKAVTLRVVSAGSSPSSRKNILMLGASCTAGGYYPLEFKRRLVESGGTPAGSGFSNINFVGRMAFTDGGRTVNFEATGGYHYGSYLTNTKSFKFEFVAANPANVTMGAVYSDGTYQYVVTEINLTAGVGNISCSCNRTTDISGSGTLTLVSGTGDEQLHYSNSWTTGNPFVYNGQVDIAQYAANYGAIDVVFFELSVNSTNSNMTNFDTLFSQMRQLINLFKAYNSNIKICVGTNWENDVLGGMGANYGAGQQWAWRYGRTITNHNMLTALQKYITDENLGDYVYILNILNEFDCEAGYPRTTKPMNTRSALTEPFGLNGNHPIANGYYQWSDTAWRLFVAKFCQ